MIQETAKTIASGKNDFAVQIFLSFCKTAFAVARAWPSETRYEWAKTLCENTKLQRNPDRNTKTVRGPKFGTADMHNQFLGGLLHEVDNLCGEKMNT